MKFKQRKRTPKIKIDELELRNFPVVGDPDPYWNDLYTVGAPAAKKPHNYDKTIH